MTLPKNTSVSLGIPQAMLYFNYAPFVDALASQLPVKIIYSGKTDRQKLEMGIRNCADDACLPVKILCGHIKSLENKCDLVALPRIMQCEYGNSMCPKINGLPEFAAGCMDNPEKLIFTQKTELADRHHFESRLTKELRRLVPDKGKVKNAVNAARHSWAVNGEPRMCETEYKKTVFLSGHLYNIADSFANMNLIKKLHSMNIGVITSGAVPREYKMPYLKKLMKKPFWHNTTELYGAARFLENNKIIDGIICLSSFSCGTDSITSELIQNSTKLPFMTLKIDEQTGEAGFDTRIEAFREVLFS